MKKKKFNHQLEQTKKNGEKQVNSLMNDIKNTKKKIEDLTNKNSSLQNVKNNNALQIQQLKKSIQEKDKEIERLKNLKWYHKLLGRE